MKHFVGVDVGASHIESAYAIDNARPIARATRPGTVVRHDSMSQAVEAVTTSVDVVLPAGVSTNSLNTIVVGSAGVHSDSIRREFEDMLKEALLDTTLHVTTDGVIALESAYGDRPGIVICAGSGSIAYARDHDGVVSRVGGLGPILADEGSGYALGLAGIRAAARSLDGRKPSTSLAKAIPTSLNIANMDELIDWAWAASRPTVAAVARTVLQEAESGDEVAAAIVKAAARDLADLVIALTRKLGAETDFHVAFSGGILDGDSPVRRELIALVSSHLPRMRIVEKTVDPVVGALSIACELSEM